MLLHILLILALVRQWDLKESIQYNTIQYNTIAVYCENTLSYNNGVLSPTEPKSGQ